MSTSISEQSEGLIMESQEEKVYVAIGNDLQDGFGALKWTLKRWSSQSTSIVILHADNEIIKDYVQTPFGKLPAKSLCDEKLKVIRNYEQGQNDKILLGYVQFCGKVKTETLKVEIYDQPMDEVILDLISSLKITKLVMAMTFMKSIPRKSKSVISGLYSVHRQKPDFCELYIICGRKLVSIREQTDEGFVVDDQGSMVAKMREKATVKSWLGKMFKDSPTNSPTRRMGNPQSPSSVIPDSQNHQWENNAEEIGNYIQKLSSLNLDEDDDADLSSPPQQDLTPVSRSNMIPGFEQFRSVDEKIKAMRSEINKASYSIQLQRKEMVENVRRHAKAQWAVCLSNRRSTELETKVQEEISARTAMEEELHRIQEKKFRVLKDVEERKSKLEALLELQTELTNKLNRSSEAKTNAEAQLETVLSAEPPMVREIAALRGQRDVFHRRIECCKEDDAAGMTTSDDLGYFSCTEYGAEDIIKGTDDFSERARISSEGDGSNVYKARIKNDTVAVERLNDLSEEVFHARVKFLSRIRHPNVVAMVGISSEPKCIVFEYMHKGSLRDALLPSNSSSSEEKHSILQWPDRVRIASEICSGLGFLHSFKPNAITHGKFNASSVLLDHNLKAKIQCSKLELCGNEHNERTNLQDLGFIIMQLLTGQDLVRGVQEVMGMSCEALIGDLDTAAGSWPADLAEELAMIAMRCLSAKQEGNAKAFMTSIIEELTKIRRMADDALARGEIQAPEEDQDAEEAQNDDVPRAFYCPIFQDVMQNPYVAADGFSYELDGIKEWLIGHDTSPMTNLKLENKYLMPNHSLRSLIVDWHQKRSIPLS